MKHCCLDHGAGGKANKNDHSLRPLRTQGPDSMHETIPDQFGRRRCLEAFASSSFVHGHRSSFACATPLTRMRKAGPRNAGRLRQQCIGDGRWEKSEFLVGETETLSVNVRSMAIPCKLGHSIEAFVLSKRLLIDDNVLS